MNQPTDPVADTVDGPTDDVTTAILARFVADLGTAHTDNERAEALAELLESWYDAWPDTAVTDPHEVIAGQIVRLMGRIEEARRRPLDGPATDLVEVATLAERDAMRPVVEAAVAWLAGEAQDGYEDVVWNYQHALKAAVERYQQRAVSPTDHVYLGPVDRG